MVRAVCFFILLSFIDFTFSAARECAYCRDVEIYHNYKDYKGWTAKMNSGDLGRYRCSGATEQHTTKCDHSCMQVRYTVNSKTYYYRDCIFGLLFETPELQDYTDYQGTGHQEKITSSGALWQFDFCNNSSCFAVAEEKTVSSTSVTNTFAYTSQNETQVTSPQPIISSSGQTTHSRAASVEEGKSLSDLLQLSAVIFVVQLILILVIIKGYKTFCKRDPNLDMELACDRRSFPRNNLLPEAHCDYVEDDIEKMQRRLQTHLVRE